VTAAVRAAIARYWYTDRCGAGELKVYELDPRTAALLTNRIEHLTTERPPLLSGNAIAMAFATGLGVGPSSGVWFRRLRRSASDSSRVLHKFLNRAVRRDRHTVRKR